MLRTDGLGRSELDGVLRIDELERLELDGELLIDELGRLPPLFMPPPRRPPCCAMAGVARAITAVVSATLAIE